MSVYLFLFHLTLIFVTYLQFVFILQVQNKVSWNKALSVDQAVVGLPVHQAVVGEVAGAVQKKDDLPFLKILH